LAALANVDIYSQSPSLNEAVRSGSLPAVTERLPAYPIVVRFNGEKKKSGLLRPQFANADGAPQRHPSGNHLGQ
jgi:hypothetical protein